MQVRTVERKIVIPAVPQNYIGLPLDLLEDLVIVDSGVNDGLVLEVGFILFPLLDGAVVPGQVLESGEPLDSLALQVAIGHRMAHYRDAQAPTFENGRHPSGKRALPDSGSHGADGDHGKPASQGGRARTQQAKVGPVG